LLQKRKQKLLVNFMWSQGRGIVKSFK